MNIKKSICGFECVFARKSDVRAYFDFLSNRFNHYYFVVADAAIYSYNKRIEILDTFQPSYFRELVEKSFVGERFVLHLYPENAGYEEIDTYEDFLRSNCEMMILLYDFYYMEIYCKNQMWIRKFIREAINIPNTVVKEKDENTDKRTTMCV